MRRDIIVTGTAFIVIIIIFIVFYVPEETEEVGIIKRSSYSASPTGTRAFYLLLQKLGYQVHQWREPYRELPDNDSLLIIIEPASQRSQFTYADINHLKSWVIKGGKAMIFLEGENSIFNTLGIRSRRLKRTSATLSNKNDAFGTLSTSLYNKEAEKIEIKASYRLETPKKLAYTILFSDTNGIAAVKLPYGKGSFILVSDPYIVANHGINDKDNGIFAYNLIYDTLGKNGKITIDEFHHGYFQGNKNITAFFPDWFKIALLQLLLIVLLYLVTISQRFGNPLPQTEKKRNPYEYVTSMATLYRKAKVTQEIFPVLYQNFRKNLARSLKIDHKTSNEELVKLYEKHYKQKAPALKIFLDDCQSEKKSLSEGELFNYVKQMDYFIGNRE